MMRVRATMFLVAITFAGSFGTIPAIAEDLAIDILTLKSPVSAGEMAELVIQTEVGAMCLGNAWPESRPSQRAQLSGKTVHGEGQATWSWPVPKGSPDGPWKIDLQCATSEKKVRLNLSFEVR